MTNFLYTREINKLVHYLADKEMNYELHETFNGYIVIVYDEEGERSWDAICHDGSYGHELGLLEVMGQTVVRDTYDTVEGYLTANDIIKRLEENKK